jgi:hypothetical protein
VILGGGQRFAAAVLAAIAGVFLPHEIPAQTVEGISSDSIAFLSAARKAATRYADRERAIAEGYRPLGPETPSMGAHWVHIGLIADHVFDPARPSLLSYVTVDGDPLLAGVGFALALDGGEEPPAAPDGGMWHDHAGTVAEEVREHGQEAAAVTSGPRVAVLHAWLGVPNHAGTFATENWSLPWVRLGLRPPPEAPVDAARAAAMAAGLTDF